MPAQIGTRVVRGPDWKWGNEDGGEGSVGTVIDICGDLEDQPLVDVCWDNGFIQRDKYRTGPAEAYDLRVLDNGQTGVVHKGISCDICNVKNLKGTRWKCCDCSDFDLCNTCYMDGQHNTNHTFWRLVSPTAAKVNVQQRTRATAVLSKGIFPGAVVTRGEDWSFGNQDGGTGQEGIVLDVMDWNPESARSGAAVNWPTGVTNNYRVGYEGKMDLKCTNAENGGFYYQDHLPLLGQPAKFHTEDRVRLELAIEDLQKLQKNPKEWPKDFLRCLGEAGTIEKKSKEGKLHVNFDNGLSFKIFKRSHLVKLFPGDEGYSKPPECSRKIDNEAVASTSQEDVQPKSHTPKKKKVPTATLR